MLSHRRPGAHPADGRQHRQADAQRGAQWRRTLRRRLHRLRAGAVVRLARAQRLRRHHHDHVRPRWPPRDRAHAGAAFLLYVLGMITGVVTIPLVVAGPALVAKWLPEQSRLAQPALLADGPGAVHLLPRDALPRVGAGADRAGATTCPARCSRCSAGSSAPRCCASCWSARRQGSTSIYGPLAAPIAVLLWLYLLSIAVLIGAALNAAFDQIWPQKELTTRAARAAQAAQAGERAALADLAGGRGRREGPLRQGERPCARTRRHAVRHPPSRPPEQTRRLSRRG